jgi:hypothetical protein
MEGGAVRGETPLSVASVARKAENLLVCLQSVLFAK